jgi:hypothetical protein
MIVMPAPHHIAHAHHLGAFIATAVGAFVAIAMGMWAAMQARRSDDS